MQASYIRQQLLKRRREILDQRESITSSWEELSEREIELEAQAARETMAWTLDRLEDQEKAEVEQIDAALGKLETGGFGVCESCGERISEGRLKAIPWTPLCIECAETQESGPKRVAPDFAKTSAGSGVSGEQKNYTDKEIQEMIKDELFRDRRVETQELKINVKDGWIYLEGFLPAETSHEILISIVQDVLGFKDIVDRIQIDRQLWEQQRRSRGTGTQEVTEKEKKMDSEAGETDAWTSRQDGTPLEPPDEMAPGANKPE
ncbi:MAG: TraR/DksA family transcriptional regulator [Desulfobacterales bacterium]